MKKAFVGVLTFLFAFVFVTSNAYAKVISDQKGTVTIASNEIINDDLFLAGNTVEINGTVNGDVYAAGKTVRLTGKVNGNLHVGAQTVIDNGLVSGSLYVGAQSVTLNAAKVGGSLIVGASSVYIDKDSSIGHSLVVGSGDLINNAPVVRNVLAGAGSVSLDSSVGGEVRLGSSDIKIGPNAKIAKDFVYMTGDKTSNVDISKSASIAGVTKKVESQINKDVNTQQMKANANRFFSGFKAGLTLISFLGALLVGFIVLKLLPQKFPVVAAQITNNPLKSLGLGFLVAVLFLPVILVLAITIIGLPLAGLLVLVFLIDIYFTKLVVGLSVGNWLSEKFGWKKVSNYGNFTLGLLIVYVLKAVPFIGFFFSVLVFFTGLGAIVSYCKNNLLAKN